MKKRIIWIVTLLCAWGVVFAESKEHCKNNPHEIRIGIAEDIILKIVETPVGGGRMQNVNEGYYVHGTREYNYGSTGHLFAEYQYRINSLVGVGGLVDVRGGFWKQKCYSVCAFEDNTYVRNMYSVRMSVMPTLRLTYFHGKAVSLYASFGAGVHVNMHATEDAVVYPAVDICYFGMNIGKGNWFCDLELGATPLPYLANRLLRFGVGYRF